MATGQLQWSHCHLHFKELLVQVRWHGPLIRAHRRQMAADICKFESLVYRASSRTTQGYTEKPYLKKNKSNRICFLYVCMSSVSEYAQCVQVPAGASRGHQSSWSWNYRRLRMPAHLGAGAGLGPVQVSLHFPPQVYPEVVTDNTLRQCDLQKKSMNWNICCLLT